MTQVWADKVFQICRVCARSRRTFPCAKWFKDTKKACDFIMCRDCAARYAGLTWCPEHIAEIRKRHEEVG